MKRGKPLTADPVKVAAFVQRGRGSLKRGGAPAARAPVRQPRAAAPKDWRAAPCICGCGHPVVARHHAIYEAELRRIAGAGGRLSPVERDDLARLVSDPRNLVAVAFDCHGAHHLAAERYRLAVLPDSVFEFAAAILGARAYGYLRRRYAGDDARLDAMLLIEAA